MLLSRKSPWHRKADALFMVSYFPLQVLIVFANAAILLAYALDLFIAETRIWLAFFGVAYLILLSDTLMSLLNLWERFGVIRGAVVFFRSVIPMSILHVSFIPHYVQQFWRCLRGYARFNVTKKYSERVEGRWCDTYADNRFTIWVGTVQLTLACIGVLRHGVAALELAALAPFIYNSVVWTIGAFAFIPRRRTWAKCADIALALPYVLCRSCVDLACLIGHASRICITRHRSQKK